MRLGYADPPYPGCAHLYKDHPDFAGEVDHVAFKRNVSVAYAWEPVFVKAARKPIVSTRHISRDWVDAPITLKRGLVGAKPEKVCWWAFEMLGARPEDELVDLFPGTGAVTTAWRRWGRLFVLPGGES